MKTNSTDIKSEYDFTILSLNIPASLHTKLSADAHLAEAKYCHRQPTLNTEMSLKIPSRNFTHPYSDVQGRTKCRPRQRLIMQTVHQRNTEIMQLKVI
jgi:hypothetical protein